MKQACFSTLTPGLKIGVHFTEIKIISFITKPKTIKKILDAMHVPSQKPEPLAHSPPLFRDTTYVPL